MTHKDALIIASKKKDGETNKQLFTRLFGHESNAQEEASFNTWLRGDSYAYPKRIAGLINLFLDKLRKETPPVPLSLSNKKQMSEMKKLSCTLKTVDEDWSHYVYIYFNLCAVDDFSKPTRDEFIKGVIYVGKGIGQRVYHNNVKDRLNEVLPKLVDDEHKPLWTSKVPFNELSDYQSKTIEAKLLNYLCEGRKKHLWGRGHQACNGNWKCCCLINDNCGNDRSGKLDDRDEFCSASGGELLDQTFEYFSKKVFPRLYREMTPL